MKKITPLFILAITLLGTNIGGAQNLIANGTNVLNLSWILLMKDHLRILTQ